MQNEKIIWDYLKNQNFTDAGSAGLIGNLYAESGLNPINLQNTANKRLNLSDQEYTKQVDSGLYNNFIRDKAGYGIAQWTYYSRKEELLKLSKKRNISIGDLKLQLDFLIIELNRYFKPLLNLLRSTTSIEEASTAVLTQFERPADQSLTVQQQRIQYSRIIYDNCKNKEEGRSYMKYNKNNPPLICMMTNSTCYKKTRQMRILGVLVHSTGANNPYLKRYVQPDDEAPNREELIKKIGKNNYNTDLNHCYRQAGLNAWVGKMEDGSVSSIQTMPWNFRPWGCGSGPKGSCNSGWIQFEICEDNLNDPVYFKEAYNEACELTAYICTLYKIDPNGSVVVNGTRLPTILCHADSHRYGFGSNHADITHWFPKYGKSMKTFRADIIRLMKGDNQRPNTDIIPPKKPEPIIPKPVAPIIPIEEDEEMTQEKFNEMINSWIATQANKQPSTWSKEARDWAENEKLVLGDEKGRKMYKKFITREEFVQVLYRALHK